MVAFLEKDYFTCKITLVSLTGIPNSEPSLHVKTQFNNYPDAPEIVFPDPYELNRLFALSQSLNAPIK